MIGLLKMKKQITFYLGSMKSIVQISKLFKLSSYLNCVPPCSTQSFKLSVMLMEGI